MDMFNGGSYGKSLHDRVDGGSYGRALSSERVEGVSYGKGTHVLELNYLNQWKACLEASKQTNKLKPVKNAVQVCKKYNFALHLLPGQKSCTAFFTGFYSVVLHIQTFVHYSVVFLVLVMFCVKMVVYFTAIWCKPCKLLEPAINDMAAKFTDVDFIKIDTDKLVSVSAQYGIQTMPTFILMKNGKEVDKVCGVKKDELQIKVMKYRSAQQAYY